MPFFSEHTRPLIEGRGGREKRTSVTICSTLMSPTQVCGSAAGLLHGLTPGRQGLAAEDALEEEVVFWKGCFVGKEFRVS